MSLGGGGDSQLQELAQQLEALEQQREALEAEVEGLQAQKQEINEAIEAIEGLESESTVQVPIGGGAYIRAKIEDINEVVVDLGGGYAAERDQEGAVSTLETKQGTLDERIEDVRSEIAELETETEELEKRAQQLQTQQMQQMQQQQQPDE
ncbi:MAG: prefoldin subunit alpha [Haloarculaceae archaeon]|jgi:prefoldin alpha subunit